MLKYDLLPNETTNERENRALFGMLLGTIITVSLLSLAIAYSYLYKNFPKIKKDFQKLFPSPKPEIKKRKTILSHPSILEMNPAGKSASNQKVDSNTSTLKVMQKTKGKHKDRERYADIDTKKQIKSQFAIDAISDRRALKAAKVKESQKKTFTNPSPPQNVFNDNDNNTDTIPSFAMDLYKQFDSFGSLFSSSHEGDVTEVIGHSRNFGFMGYRQSN